MSQQLHVKMEERPGGALIADYSADLLSGTYATGQRGPGDARLQIRMPTLEERIRTATRVALPHISIGDGAALPYEGRLEGVPIGGQDLELNALGYSRAMEDIPYTALWSDAQLVNWAADSPTVNVNNTLYEINTDTKLSIATRKGESFVTSVDLGLIRHFTPDDGSRQVVGIQFNYRVNLPLNWRVQFIGANSGYASPTGAWLLNATGALQTGAIHSIIPARDFFYLQVFNNTGATSTPPGDSGDNFVEITNVRVVSSTNNSVFTTLTANVSAGSNVILPVATAARMYAGQRLIVNSGNNPSESVIIASFSGGNPVAATLANNYTSGQTVRAHVIFAEEIVRDMLASAVAANPNQLSPATGMVQSPALDLTDEVYEDQSMASVLDYLIGLGDSQSPPRQWNWRIGRGRVLVFEPRGAYARTWYIDVAPDDLEIDPSIEDLINSVYASYQEPGGRTLRTATANDTVSQARYGLVRRAAVSVQTSSATQAGIHRDTYLQDRKTPIPKVRVRNVAQLFDAGGIPVPVWQADAGRGDIIVIRNLSPLQGTTVDRIRNFRLLRAEIDMVAGLATLEAEAPPAALEVLAAREKAGI